MIQEATSAADRPARIVVLDDHPLVIDGIRSTLANDTTIVLDWLGSRTNYAAFRLMLDELEVPPDIALVDLHLNDGSRSVDVIEDLTRQGLRCVVLTSERRPVPIRRAVTAGAVGLIMKSDPPSAMAQVLRDVAAGEFGVSSDLAFTLVSDVDACAQLSPREVEVLDLLARGHTRRSVAKAIQPPVSESTVSTHLERIFLTYRLLGRNVRSTVDAVREATHDGYFGGEEQH